ncbi:MAG: signal recognition particle-docking protein FtsY [bacterium]
MNKEKRGFLSRFKRGMAKTSNKLEEQIDSIDCQPDEVEENLEEILISSDIGVNTTLKLLENLDGKIPGKHRNNPVYIKEYLKSEISDILETQSTRIDIRRGKPFVIMVVGVNGSGKTTSIGKLAHRFVRGNLKVTLAAADTFRAGAIDQLESWAYRSGAGLIKHQPGADPSAVVFDSLSSARKKGSDILIIDTAGRLHNKKNLMDELEKMKRVVQREIPEAPHECLLVIDGHNGQNAIQQAREFDKMMELSGIIITKLDGTSKGGALINIVDELKIPVKLVGVGEQVEDLDTFEPAEFVSALFS